MISQNKVLISWAVCSSSSTLQTSMPPKAEIGSPARAAL